MAIAGPDMSITLPDTSYVILDGTRSYDPEKVGLTLNWIQLSGPQTLSFNNNHTKSGEAFVSFGNSGRYLFQLTVRDDKYSVSDTVEIVVRWAAECNANREMVSAETVGVGFSPKKISYAASYAVGTDQLVFAGGVLTEPFWPDDPPATLSSAVHLYDMKTNTWSEWEMLRAKTGMASVIAGNQLFLGGGFVQGGNITDEVEIYDLATKNITKARLSAPRVDLSAAAAANKVIFAGGSNKDGVITDAVDIYDHSTNTWSTAKLSEPRINMSVLVNGSKIYLVGGISEFSGNGISNTVDVFDAVSGTWSVLKLSHPGSGMQTALFGNKMILAGGITGSNSNLSTRLEFIDLSNWSSTVDCLLFTPYYEYGPRGNGMNIAVIGDKIYFGSNEFISLYDGVNNLWKYARVETYQGILFTYQRQLYGFRYTFSEDGKGQYEVIRIGL